MFEQIFIVIMQDAQEFSKLFLTVLEGALSSELLGPGTNIIQEQFSGIYCYITRYLQFLSAIHLS